MVRITEEEFKDSNGQVKKVRKIEAARARIERPDGTVEEYSGINAEEWPWNLEGKSPEWRVLGIPMQRIFEMGHSLSTSTLTLFSGNGEAILKIGSITIGMQLSSGGSESLIGKETPLDS